MYQPKFNVLLTSGKNTGKMEKLLKSRKIREKRLPKGIIRRILRASQTSEIEVKSLKVFLIKYSEVLKKKFNTKKSG